MPIAPFQGVHTEAQSIASALIITGFSATADPAVHQARAQFFEQPFTVLGAIAA